ncbi:MAG: glycosyltransferase [Clostridia bacterium]|nr:glycosyltransferase [Clostridia bacterium]
MNYHFVYSQHLLEFHIAFDKFLAKRIYASADIFLMPSKSEPCGLAQMISARYGTVPIVRETGGLYDSIKPYNPETGEGNGITFATYNAHDMLDAVCRTLAFYSDKNIWRKIRKNAMKSDFTWGRSAKEYLDLYQNF